jgi:hypothetical protein
LANKIRVVKARDCGGNERSEKMTEKRLLVFCLANASVAIFFDGFWLLGYRIQALDDLSGELGYFQFVLWFVSFFIASFLPLRAIVRRRIVAKCLGLALVFSFLLWCLLLISSVILGPYIDPWF